MADEAREMPETYEKLAIRAVEQNKTDEAVIFSNLAISKAISRLTEEVAKREG